MYVLLFKCQLINCLVNFLILLFINCLEINLLLDYYINIVIFDFFDVYYVFVKMVFK